MKKILILSSIIFPIVVLIIIVLNSISILKSGKEYELPISGFDPIDPLSGHYVTYRVDYGFNPCEVEGVQCLCFDKYPKENIFIPDICGSSSCSFILSGECKGQSFIAGIEKYSIPEEKSDMIDKIVRKGKSKLIISINNSDVRVKDLILLDE